MAGITLPLLTLSAACLGTQLTLSPENLPFGTVVLGSKVTPHASRLAFFDSLCLMLFLLYGDTSILSVFWPAKYACCPCTAALLGHTWRCCLSGAYGSDPTACALPC